MTLLENTNLYTNDTDLSEAVNLGYHNVRTKVQYMHSDNIRIHVNIPPTDMPNIRSLLVEQFPEAPYILTTTEGDIPFEARINRSGMLELITDSLRVLDLFEGQGPPFRNALL